MSKFSHVDYERQLIVNILMDPSIIDEVIDSDFDINCFTDNMAIQGYKWIRDRYMNNKPISKVKFQTESKVDALELLDNNIPFEIETTETNDICEYLVKRKTRIKLDNIGKEIRRVSQEETELSKEELENKVQEIVFNATDNSKNNQGVYDIYSALNMFHQEFYDIQEGKKHLTGLPTGIPRLDYLTGGSQRKHLTVIGASTSIGKTSLAILWLLNMIKSGLKGAFISMEMDAIEVVRKLVALDSRVPTSLYTKKFTDKSGQPIDKQKKTFDYIKNNMELSMERLHELNCYISDTRGLSTADIKARCRKFAKEMGGLDIVVVDYLQMINHSPGEKKSDRVGQTVLELRNMAGELDCNVTLLAQFNRSANGRPKMEYMRDSGNIEEIADEIILPYRLNYRADNNGPEEAQLIIDKGRTVGTGAVDMIFYPSIQFWRDKVEEQQHGPLQIIERC